MPRFSLRSSKLVLYNEFLLKNTVSSPVVISPVRKQINKVVDLFQNEFSSVRDAFVKSAQDLAHKKEVIKKLPVDRFHNFDMSPKAMINLREKINWMYHLSRSRTKKTYTGKEIYNFKMCFLTLTLPSKQMHPTSEITAKCLNQFITEVKTTHKMDNYVWRLEFQKNGNVHYHLVTDTFVSFHYARNCWNRIISKLGYVEPYTAKHSAMSLNDYCTVYSDNGKNDFPLLAKRYALGKSEKWKNPPSVDVKSVVSNKNIAYYISKYFSKGEKSGTKKNPLDSRENSENMRLWFCSRSLSKLKSISDYVEAFSFDIAGIVRSSKKILEVAHDYCRVIYFSISDYSNEAKAILYQILRGYSSSLGYISSS